MAGKSLPAVSEPVSLSNIYPNVQEVLMASDLEHAPLDYPNSTITQTFENTMSDNKKPGLSLVSSKQLKSGAFKEIQQQNKLFFIPFLETECLINNAITKSPLTGNNIMSCNLTLFAFSHAYLIS